MNRLLRHALTTATVTALAITTLTSCVNVADVGTPLAPTTTTVPATTTTLAPTTVTDPAVSGTTATDPTDAAPSTSLPEERRTPGVTYCVPASAAVSPSFFDDAVIAGDSITLKLHYYHVAYDTFSNATFLTSGGLGVANAMWALDRPEAVHPSYQGQTVTLVDGITRSGCSKVYLMLGMNDIGLYGVDDTVENFKALSDAILKANPHVTLYVQSVTPMYFERGSLNNTSVNEYNAKLSAYCKEKGFYFVDVASVLRDENGALPLSYCSDPDPSVGGMGIHFTDTACQIWADYLYTHTAT